MKFLLNKRIKNFLKNSIFALVLVGVLVGISGPKIALGAACTPEQRNQGWREIPGAGIGAPVTCSPPAQAGQTNTPVNDALGGLLSVASDWIVGPVFKFIGYFLQLISGGILGISGTLFDASIKFTILEMSDKIQGEGGIGNSIDQTWGTLRDIANMFFILVLLMTAFKAMFELNTGNTTKTILNIIIVALLINFSMFFTKVVIDASNVVAVGFYNSIVNTSAPAQQATEGTREATQNSISSGYMRLLGLQSWYDPKLLSESDLDTSDILITGIMSSVFMLVVAVVMFVTSIMFIARWILLVLLIILSPVAFITIIIPGLKGNFDKWMQAVINQSFFAPIYFAMTWVVFKIAVGYQQSAGGAIGQSWSSVGIVNPSDGPVDLILKYLLIVGFSIAALIFSKQMASRTAGFTAITGAIGSGVAGSTAWAGRTFIGSAGNSLANKMQAAKGSNNFFKRSGARLLSYTGEKAAKSSFDIRNAAVPTSVVGDAIRGTIGRTSVGKKLGLNDVNIQSIDVGNRIGGGIVGTADKKGYAERKAESDKRVKEREAKEASQIKIATAKNNIIAGAKAPIGTTGPVIDEMEKSLANLSDKETEALVASNKELLESQNFANKISVKQLEAIVKSDQISDDDKSKLKNIRFSDIEKGVASSATQSEIDEMEKKLSTMSDKELEILAGNNKTLLENQRFADVIGGKQFESLNKSDQFSESEKTKLKNTRFTDINAAMATGTPAAITAVKGKIKNLSDYELETIDTSYLKNEHFVSELRPAQAEAIIKSNKFNTTQKNNLRDARKAPLVKALDTAHPGYAPNSSVVKDMITKKLNPKDVAGLMATNATFIDHTGATVTKPILTHPEILNVYNVGLLKRMAPEMSAADIQILRDVIEDAGTTPGAPSSITKLATWLHTPDGAAFS